MIEAVNSVLSSAPLLRGNAEQVSSAPSGVELDIDARGAVSVPKAPFISPYISVDLDTDRAVLQIRDSDTGDVVRQFPSEKRLQQQRAEIVAAQQQGSGESSHAVEVADSGDGGEVASSGDTGESSGSGDAGSGGVAQAQVASAALTAGAQAGAESSSAGVSVLA